jgi:DNA polymerase I-like protein with 3'-5' exonuclease and polymerase domains
MLALFFVYDNIKAAGLKALPIHTVHDELVLEVEEGQAKEAKQLLKGEMERAGREILKEVPVKVGVGISDYWEH